MGQFVMNSDGLDWGTCNFKKKKQNPTGNAYRMQVDQSRTPQLAWN